MTKLLVQKEGRRSGRYTRESIKWVNRPVRAFAYRDRNQFPGRVLATFRRKKHVFGRPCNESGRADPPAGPGPRRQGVKSVGLGLPAGLLGHHAADVDQVVGNHPEADPALHSGIPLVPAAIKSVPSLDHADATLASGTPFLAVAEPALLLLAFALGALRGAIGDADALDALGFGGRRVLGRVEAGIGRHQARCAP